MPYGLGCEVVELGRSDMEMYVIILPEPIEVTEAYYEVVFFVVEEGSDKQAVIQDIKLFTLEKSHGHSMLCAWDTKQRHFNYGPMKDNSKSIFVEKVKVLVGI